MFVLHLQDEGRRRNNITVEDITLIGYTGGIPDLFILTYLTISILGNYTMFVQRNPQGVQTEKDHYHYKQPTERQARSGSKYLQSGR